jgi:DNA-binding PadR family transcriptional regulator
VPRPDVAHFSDPSFLILASLMSGPKHGYSMMEDIQTFSGILLEPGTLYGAINRLEERGFIRAIPTDERRRPYEITAEGEALFRDRVKVFAKLADVGMQRLTNHPMANEG